VPIKRILMGLDPDDVISRETISDAHTLDGFAALARERRAIVTPRQ
jgi:hypothetical protein